MTPHDHYVFVDLENLPNIDLTPAEKDLSIHVTVLVGKNQNKVSLTLAKAGINMPGRMEIVEVGASGHNALDLTLAHYLGRAVERAPTATFTIVSKDKDFDPLIAHLHSKSVRARRHTSLATIVTAPKSRPVPAAATAASTAPVAPSTVPKKKPGDVAKKLLEDWAKTPKARPSTHTKLKALIKNRLSNDATEGSIQSVIDRLRVGGHVAIGKDGAITYRHGT